MLTKPEHVKKKIWDQHINWMNVMREGILSGEGFNSAPDQKKNKTTQSSNSIKESSTSAKVK